MAIPDGIHLLHRCLLDLDAPSAKLFLHEGEPAAESLYARPEGKLGIHLYEAREVDQAEEEVAKLMFDIPLSREGSFKLGQFFLDLFHNSGSILPVEAERRGHFLDFCGPEECRKALGNFREPFSRTTLFLL